MSEGRIAKSTESQEPSQEKKVFTTSGISSIPTVHFDILRFFNVDFNELNRGSTKEYLSDIENWTFKDAESCGDGLKKLRSLDIQLGTPQDGETRITRIHRWITMENHINDLRARQKAL